MTETRKKIQEKLLELARQDGCETSIQAASYIDYLEDVIARSREYEETLRRRLDKLRHKRDAIKLELNRLQGEQNG